MDEERKTCKNKERKKINKTLFNLNFKKRNKIYKTILF